MKTVKITLASNGNSQVYHFENEVKAKEFYYSKMHLQPTYVIELI